MSVAGWLTMTISLSLVWTATAWCFWMVLSAQRSEMVVVPETAEVDDD